MPEHQVLHGAVIISYAKRSHGVVELLAARLRHRVTFTHFLHPHEVESSDHPQFFIVFSEDDLAGIVRVYEAYRKPVPLIILIDDPAVIAEGDYARRFPGVDIAPIAQSELQDKKSTLKIILFEEIINHLAQLTVPRNAVKAPADQQSQSRRA